MGWGGVDRLVVFCLVWFWFWTPACMNPQPPRVAHHPLLPLWNTQGKVATINANQDMKKVTTDIRSSLH